MKTIGFIDYYLDEWHANNYPAWIKDISKGEYEVAYGYGAIDAPRGRTNQAWCEDMGVELCDSIEEVIEKSDYVMVLSPDNPEQHWALCQAPLRCGRPVYVDKTFAPTAQIAADLLALARENDTPVCTSSAIRFSKEVPALVSKKGTMAEEVVFALMKGPGYNNEANYLIHQVEPLVCIMKEKAVSIEYLAEQENLHGYRVCFENLKTGLIECPEGEGDFSARIMRRNGNIQTEKAFTESFVGLIKGILEFYETGISPVDNAETLEIAKILEAAEKARQNPGTKIEIN